MTTTLAQHINLNSNYSYQHIQGTMLLKLNKISFELNLSHTDYRLMGTLIGLYNKSYGKAFPTIDYLANICKMGKSTIIKSLKQLVKLNLLVVVKTPGKRNNYYFSNIILSTSGTPHAEPKRSTPCSTTHDNKQIKNKTNREQTSCHDKQPKQSQVLSNDDAFKNNKTDLIEYKTILTQLENWSFSGAKQTIKTFGIQKLKNCIEQTKQKNPDNPGAYLRSLLNCQDKTIPPTKNTDLKTPLNEGLETTKQILTINEERLSKEEIIIKLISEGKIEETEVLRKLWKL